MTQYLKRLWVYHRRFLRLYGLLILAIYGLNWLGWPTPLSLVLKPFGLTSWSAGLTRASLALLRGDLAQAWAYNPLIFPLILFIFGYIFLSPLLPAARRQFDWESRRSKD